MNHVSFLRRIYITLYTIVYLSMLGVIFRPVVGSEHSPLPIWLRRREIFLTPIIRFNLYIAGAWSLSFHSILA